MNCPVCSILSGVDAKRGKLCDDCEKNNDIKNQWDWYKIVRRLNRDSIIFLWIQPLMCLLLLVVAVMGKIGIVPLVVCSTSWVISYWSYRSRNYSELIAKEREKLFVMKVRGNAV